MKRTSTILAATALVALTTIPAIADGFNEDQAKAKMEAAGYGDVERVHQGNLGDWMAQGTKDGHTVMLVLHPDGSVALRQQLDLPPVKADPVPTAPSAPKP